MQQVSVRRWFDIAADCFRSFLSRAFWHSFGRGLRLRGVPGRVGLLPGLALTGCILLLSGCGAIAGGTGKQASSTTALGVLNSLSCTNPSVTGTLTDTCTIALNAATGSSGLSVSLSSSSAAVTVPSSVTIPANATSATFAAAISAVASSQTATLTASANGVDVSTSLQLNAGSSVLSVGATSVAFGTVALNNAAQQTIALTSTGAQPVTISSATLSGTGFSSTGVALPVVLNPGQAVNLTVTFDPTTAGLATGQLTIASNSVTGSSVVVGLSGTGGSGTGYQVDLTWNAPASSSDPVVGYNVYRSTGGAIFEVLNAVVNATTTFTDSQVQSGASYVYYVTSVDANGVESVPSSSWSATIP